MANNKDVELRIRARDESQKPLKAVTAAINQMAKAQDEQRKAAERGDISTRELEASYKKLESAGNQLLKLNSLIEVFKRQNAAMATASTKTEKLRSTQAALKAEYESSANVTQKQENALARVNKQVEAAAKAEQAQAARLNKSANELQRYGIETSKIGAAQTGIVSSIAQVNKVLARQEDIIATSPAAAAQSRVVQGLQRQADQAIATAKGYQTLGRVVQQANGQLGPLGSTIQSIVSPSEAARSTLSGLQSQVSAVATEMADGGKEIANVAQKMRLLNDANKAISGLAQQIDMYRQQISAVRSARAEYQAARAAVASLAQQMRTASTDTGVLGSQMQSAQQRLAAAAKELTSTGTAARSTQAALRAAGVDTRYLSDAETRLVSTSQQSVSSINTLTEALNRNGSAARKGGDSLSFFEKRGKEARSTIGDLKGQVLGLTAAYVGIQGAMNLAAGAIDAYKMRQQAMVKIGVVVGESQSAQAKEWEYMTGLADKLGVELGSLASSYSKFAVSAKAVGLNMDSTKFVFEQVAKAGRVFHLSTDDMDGIFKALEQMLSKGQITAEELRGQLGERIPAAFATMAKGLEMSTQDLTKAMQKGEISGEAVVNFAREQGKSIDAQLATAEKGVDAMEARAKNAETSFKLALADSGFIESYVALLAKITDYLKSADAQEAAKKLSAAFSAAADAAIWLTDHVDGLITVLELLAAVKAVSFVVGLTQSLSALGPIITGLSNIGGSIIAMLESWSVKMIAAEGAVGVLGVALKGLTRLIPYVGWALLAYDIGAIMYDQSQTFKEACNAVERDFKNLGNQLLAIVNTLPAAAWDIVVAIVRPVTTMFANTTKSIMGWIEDLLRMIPGVGQGLGDWAHSLSEDLTKEHRDLFESTRMIWDDVNKQWVKLNDEMVQKNTDATKVIKQKVADMVSDIQAATGGKGVSSGFQFTSDPGTGITKRQREVAALTKELEKMEKESEKAQKQADKAAQRKSLPGRLKLIDEEFQPQYQRAKSIGGTEGADMEKRLNAVVAARKKAETELFNATQHGTDGTKKRQTAIAALTKQYEDLNAATNSKATKQDPNASYEDKLAANLAKINTQYDQLEAKAKKIGGKEGAALGGDLKDLRARNVQYATTQTKLEHLKSLEDQLNSQQQTKKNLLEEINLKKQAGIISDQEAANQTIEVLKNMNAGIQESSDSVEEFAQKIRSTMSEEEFTALMAKIAAVKAGIKDVAGTFTDLDTAVVQGVLEGMSSTLSSVVTEMGNVVAGTQSLGQAFQNLGVSVAKFFADFLQKIAMAILQQMILNALANSGWGGVASAAQSMGGKVSGAATNHNGGIVGSATSGGQQSKTSVSAALFSNAPRFHDGGLPGLKSDEVPTILQKGEQVLSKNDPDNILNQSSGGQQQQQQQAMRFVLVDDRAKIPEAMNTPDGETAVMQILKRNVVGLKQLVR